MKYALAALALVATPAHADGFTNREIALQALNVVDTVQTCHFLSTGRAVEGNPVITGILGKHPKCGELVAFKIGFGALHWFVADRINRSDPKAAKVFQIVSIGIQGGVVAANMRFVF